MTTTTHDRAIELASEVADIRRELGELQDRLEAVMRDVRHLPGGRLVWDRVDAYPGIRLDRDMGLGQDADAWLAEVAGFLDGVADGDAPAWPEDLADGERIRITGGEGAETGTTIRIASSDRLTYRSDAGVEREVHADDGVTSERIPPSADDEGCGGFRGEDAWGPCAGCGRILADHRD